MSSEQESVPRDQEEAAAAAPASSQRPSSFTASSSSSRHVNLANRILRPFKKAWRATAKWTAGPDPPVVQRINPLFPRIQTAPLKLLAMVAPKRKHKIILLIAFYLAWMTVFVTLLHVSDFSGEIKGYGVPSMIGCLGTFWLAGNACGLDGNDCRPFTNETLAFRCPAECASVKVSNPRAVGDQEINYASFVIGGPSESGNVTYRGDSFICEAALHAGLIRDAEGGCGVAKLVGTQTSFTASKRNGIQSIGFDSSFPLSFTFVEGSGAQCKDLRWPILAASLAFTILLSLFTTSPNIFFASAFAGIFFHVGLASDPPFQADYFSVLSVVLARFLPACFIAFVYFQIAIRRSLTGLFAQIEKTVLWLGGCWIGALNNYTFGHIPLQRLTPHDLENEPGAKASLAVIVIILVFIVLGQAWSFRQEGRMRKYLAIYATMGICLGLLAAIPNLSLRIHHYILAMLLLPGTSMQTRRSLLYQGILVGLFINGVARWGFASILQTPAELIGTGQIGSELPALIAAPLLAASNITFSFTSPPSGYYDGISVLVNDVERYRGYDWNAALSSKSSSSSSANNNNKAVTTLGSADWTFVADSDLPRKYIGPSPSKYYFRWGFVRGTSPGDYTRAGVWDVTAGTWKDGPGGPSR